MNYISIVERLRFRKVTYYTIQFEERNDNEFDNFILRHKDGESASEMRDILALLQFLGDEIGAREERFRHEQKAYALPSNRRFMQRFNHPESNMRLYCLWICERIVILFNGGVKSTNVRTAQECPSIGRYFKEANVLAQKIDRLIIENDISVDTEGGNLVFNTTNEFLI